MIQTMILNDTAMNDYERVKKWREKNRARYNLYQRNRRKDLKGNFPVSGRDTVRSESSGAIAGVAPKSGTTIEILRELERKERERVVEVPASPPARFGTYRDDGGRPITERAWNELQKKKERAEKGGYVYDEFSQA